MSYLKTHLLEWSFQIPHLLVYIYYYSNILKCKWTPKKTYFLYLAIGFVYSFLPFVDRNDFVFRTLGLIISIVFPFCFFEGKFKSKLSAFIVQYLITAITDCVCLLLLYSFSFDFQQTVNTSEERFLGQTLATVVMFPLYMLAIVIYNRRKKLITPRYILSIIILPITQLLILMLNMLAQNGILDIKNLFLIFLNQAIFITLECLQFSAVKNNIAYEKQQQELQAYQQKSDMDYQFYMLTEQHLQTLSQMRHDIHNQISTIHGFIAEKELTLADELSDSLENELESTKTYNYCKSPIINTVITIKQKSIKENGVKINLNLNDTEKINIPNHQLCSLFSNLLDLSIYLCIDTNIAFKRKIDLNTNLVGDNIVVVMRILPDDTGTYTITEADIKRIAQADCNELISLKIIEKILSESNGSIQQNISDGCFETILNIPCKQR